MTANFYRMEVPLQLMSYALPCEVEGVDGSCCSGSPGGSPQQNSQFSVNVTPPCVETLDSHSTYGPVVDDAHATYTYDSFLSGVLDNCYRARIFARYLVYLLKKYENQNQHPCPMPLCQTRPFNCLDDMLRHLKICKSFSQEDMLSPASHQPEPECQRCSPILSDMTTKHDIYPTPFHRAQTPQPTKSARILHQLPSASPEDERRELDPVFLSRELLVDPSPESSLKQSQSVFIYDSAPSVCATTMVTTNPNKEQIDISPVSAVPFTPPQFETGGITNDGSDCMRRSRNEADPDFYRTFPSLVAHRPTLDSFFPAGDDSDLASLVASSTFAGPVAQHGSPNMQTSEMETSQQYNPALNLPLLDPYKMLDEIQELDDSIGAQFQSGITHSARMSRSQLRQLNTDTSNEDSFTVFNADSSQDTSPLTTTSWAFITTSSPTSWALTTTSSPTTVPSEAHYQCSPIDQEYKCPDCDFKPTGKTENRKAYLRKHISNHHPIRIPCTLCNSSFTRQDNFKTHLKNFHNNISTSMPCKRRPNELDKSASRVQKRMKFDV
ncbi:hypothetical protein GGS21DRAFT_245049 [Xylaria nigripes]|nr:hypothetical protein GGS21DRAFT_245049 [Xylaria nigripes]